MWLYELFLILKGANSYITDGEELGEAAEDVHSRSSFTMRTRHVAGQLQGAFQGLALNPKAKRSRTSTVRSYLQVPIFHSAAWASHDMKKCVSRSGLATVLGVVHNIVEILSVGVQSNRRSPFSG